MTTFNDMMARTMSDLRAAQQSILHSLQTEKSRKRGDLNRQLHEVRRMIDASAYPFHSQAGQDLVLDGIFDRKRGGTFVDVGGYDGVIGSNSLFFEHWRDWTGILVEPVQLQIDRAKILRKCPCLQYAVAATDGEAEFVEITEGYTQMSGLAGSYDPALLQRVRDDPRHKETTVKVQTRTLSRLLSENGIPNPDFISLDIEGGEVSVLSTFPFDQHRVGAWAIENNNGTDEIARIMQPAGYDLVEFCGPDEIWKRRDL